MWERGNGEKLLVAATLEPVEKGQEFETIPPHMTVIGWLAMQEFQRPMLYRALGNIFVDDYYQDVIGASKAMFGKKHNIPVRTLKNVEQAPWVGLHALVESINGFPEDDPFIDVFEAHVTDTPEREVERDEHLALSTVAVFSKGRGALINRVEEVYPLGRYRNQ